MAELNANAGYLTFDGVDMVPYLQSFDIKPTANTVNTTAGNVGHTLRQAGLRSTSLTANIIYRVGGVATYLAKIKPGAEVTVDWGPEGNTTGKPRHTQKFIITDSSTSQDAEKKVVQYAVTAENSAEPTNDKWNGATW
jgi:hypothetical protein